MPSTPLYALPYPAPTDPADVPADIKKLADQIVVVLGGALAASPPASPSDGQLWAMSPAAGIAWVFRYNAGSASAYKWEFVGGPPLFAQVPTATGFNNVTYGDGGPAGPTITLPRAGDYLIRHGCKIDAGTATGLFAAQSYAIGAAAAVDADMVEVNSGTGGGRFFGLREQLKTGLSAVALTCKYRSSAAVTFSERTIAAIPNRVS